VLSKAQDLQPGHSKLKETEETEWLDNTFAACNIKADDSNS